MFFSPSPLSSKVERLGGKGITREQAGTQWEIHRSVSTARWWFPAPSALRDPRATAFLSMCIHHCVPFYSFVISPISAFCLGEKEKRNRSDKNNM